MSSDRSAVNFLCCTDEGNQLMACNMQENDDAQQCRNKNGRFAVLDTSFGSDPVEGCRIADPYNNGNTRVVCAYDRETGNPDETEKVYFKDTRDLGLEGAFRGQLNSTQAEQSTSDGRFCSFEDGCARAPVNY